MSRAVLSGRSRRRAGFPVFFFFRRFFDQRNPFFLAAFLPAIISALLRLSCCFIGSGSGIDRGSRLCACHALARVGGTVVLFGCGFRWVGWYGYVRGIVSRGTYNGDACTKQFLFAVYHFMQPSAPGFCRWSIHH